MKKYFLLLIWTLLFIFFCKDKPTAPKYENLYDPQYLHGDNLPPIAAFTISTTDSFTFTFNASASHDTDPIACQLFFRWDWEGDGNWDLDWTIEPMAQHIYYQGGSKTVILEVRGVQGLKSQASQKIKVVNKAGMVFIPANSFQMGSSEGGSHERPIHTVYLDGFWMDRYEVTNAAYKIFCDATGRGYPSDPASGYFLNYPNYPVVNVSWNDAKAYADWVGKRLPSEAEWEYAARGGLAGKKYPWGDEDPTTRCNYWYYSGPLTSQMPNFSSNRGPLPVGSFAANGYGLYDMAGNVWEWCADWYDSGYYSVSSAQNPQGSASGSYRVVRGGSWYDNDSSIRCANRSNDNPDNRNYYIGFRCVRQP